jgi:5-methylcytosine-specific restriction endonuclease McrA
MSRHRVRTSVRGNRVTSGDRRRAVARLLQRDGNVCYYCREDFTEEVLPTIDHILPVSQGGDNRLANLVLACDWCNRHRGTKTIDQFIIWLADNHVPASERKLRKLH